ncbi:MAG: hypothetical protein QXQ43_04515 [Nitrososphaerota archaeon]
MLDPFVNLDPLISDQYLTGSYAHPNPAYDYSTAFLPRKLKDFFRWSEYLFTNSPQVFAVVQKYAAFATNKVKITPIHEETSKTVIDRYERIFKAIDIDTLQIMVAINTIVYGNSFVNILPNIMRFLACDNCGKKFPISSADYKFNPSGKDKLFFINCPSCKTRSTATVIDFYERNQEKPFSIVLWDPKFMDIEYNKFTGEEIIYATIDGETASKIRRGDRYYIEKVDIELIKTAIDNKDKMFKFNPKYMKHIKLPALAGLEQQWGYPMLVSTLKSFLHAAILKKANEAIALDYLIPLRVVFPTGSGTFDPTQMMNLELWKNEFIKSVKQWRRDPLHIEIAPVPVGRVQVGGEGRSLLTFQEIQIAEENILAALGVPKEIIYGSLQWKAAPITLRMLSKQLEPITSQLNQLVQWIADTIADLEKLPKVNAEIVPFKLVDDTDEKMILLQSIMAPQPGSLVSAKTIGEALGIDVEKEQQQLEREALEAKRREVRLNEEMNKIMQEAIATQQQSQSQSIGAQSISNAEQAIMEEARQYVEQLAQMPPQDRKRYLIEIGKSRPVLHAVIIEMLEDYRQQIAHEGKRNINPNV